jgi:Phycobilisome degradation protein nblA
MNLPLELSMEQQFNLRMYEGQVKDLSSEQAQNFLLEVMRQLMIKENVIKHLMKGSINI